MNKSYSFLTIGKTQNSLNTTEFKRYIGIGSSYILAVNPTKKELETIYGTEIANDPEYVVNTDNGKEARVTFIVKTDPEVNNGIELTTRVAFVLYNTPAYNKDKTKVRVIDVFGNSVWANTEDVENHKKLVSDENKDLKIDANYRKAYRGEAELVDFLKHYLCVQDVFNYINGSWIKKEDEDNYKCELECIKDYFSGDFTEIKNAIALQPNNKIKLLYGVRTTEEGKQYQTVATKFGMFLFNNSGSKAIEKLAKELANSKNSGAYSTTEFKVQELAEYNVEATDFSSEPYSDSINPEENMWD